MSIRELTYELSVSLRKPTRRTLSLINKALSYLIPFESGQAKVASMAERTDLLTLLNTHRMVLCPYADLDRIEWHLQHHK